MSIVLKFVVFTSWPNPSPSPSPESRVSSLLRNKLENNFIKNIFMHTQYSISTCIRFPSCPLRSNADNQNRHCRPRCRLSQRGHWRQLSPPLPPSRHLTHRGTAVVLLIYSQRVDLWCPSAIGVGCHRRDSGGHYTPTNNSIPVWEWWRWKLRPHLLRQAREERVLYEPLL